MRDGRHALVLAALAASCAGGRVVPPPAEPKEPVEVSRDRLLRDLAELREAAVAGSDALRDRGPRFGAAKGDIREVYRKVAPSTVLVRAGSGFGSGVVVAKGYVLTNHHVVAGAQQVDFTQQVQIERGALDAQGVMAAEGRTHTAWVVKSDPLLDLAVLKLDAALDELKPVRLATRPPVPGEPVSALGHGGIGLLWAIKDGEVSSIGKLATSLAQLVGAGCRASDEPAAAPCRSSSFSADLERQVLAKQVPGLVIQTSCTISPGDSGGPLVNRAGELVGVNAFLRTDARAPVTSNFHIHVAEVKEFLREVPTEPLRRAPSPWESLGWGGTWADGDGDGKNDLLVVGTTGRAAVFADLKQTTPAGGRRSKIDADFALVRVGGRLMAFYDADGDGAFDRLVVDGAKDPAKVWALTGDRIGAFLGAAKLIDPTAFGDAARRDRFSALVPLVALASGVGGEDAAEPGQLPVLPATLTAPRSLDADKDGVVDTVVDLSPFGTLTLIDWRGNALAQAKRGTALASLKAPLTVLQRGARTWYLQPEQVFVVDDAAARAVSGAWARTPAGQGEPRPLLLGLDVVSAVGLGVGAAELSRFLAVVAPGRRAMQGRGFPHPVFDVGTDVVAESSGTAQLDWSAVSVAGARGAASLLFELDATALAGVTADEREDAVREGGSGTDFAWIRRGSWEWYLSDTDHDGQFDAASIVHGSEALGRRQVKGEWVDAPELAKAPFVRASRFEGQRRDALKALAPLFFAPKVIE